jgi:hypothetical protein
MWSIPRAQMRQRLSAGAVEEPLTGIGDSCDGMHMSDAAHGLWRSRVQIVKCAILLIDLDEPRSNEFR